MIVKGKEVEVNVKRTRYADGYGTKKFKLGGVKRENVMVWFGMVWYHHT